MTESGHSESPQELVLRMLGGKWLAAALSAAAELGVADALKSGPADAESLARRLECDVASLERLLRVLASEGLLSSDTEGRYATTALGDALRSDALGPLASFVGSDAQWAPWSRLADAVRHGRSAFGLKHGAELFEYLDENHEDAARYHLAVDAFTRAQARDLAARFDFAPYVHVVDVGGGLGALAAELVSAWPHLNATLYDRPSVVELGKRYCAEAEDILPRIQWVAGDFFKSVPGDADVYVLKHVIHNWGDDDAAALLERCAAAAGPAGRVLVIEGLVLPGDRPDATRLLDLEMMAVCRGGFERSKPQFRSLFARAGLRLAETVPLVGGVRLLVGVPRPS